MSKTRLGLYSVLWVAACTSEPLSVGEPPCETGEPGCGTPEQFLVPRQTTREEVRGESHVQWHRQLLPAGCTPDTCFLEWSKFVVHGTGEVTLAVLLEQYESAEDPGHARLWVAWLDAEGELLWEDYVLNPFDDRPSEEALECPSGVPSCVGPPGGLVTSFDLRATPDGRAIAVVGYELVGSGQGPTRNGLIGHAIERMGRVTPTIKVDSLDVAPDFSALIEDDVVIAERSAPAAFMRYSARGELLWRRSDAVAPPPDGSSPNLDATVALQVATDGLGRVWALLDADGVFGFLRLEATGRPAWRAWAGTDLPPRHNDQLGQFSPTMKAGFELVFDRQQRALFAATELGVLRVDPDAEGPERWNPSFSASEPEEYYSPSDAFGLATDEQDRVYLATHEGPRSAERLRIDRISSDFLRREIYIVDVGEIQPNEQPAGLHVTPGGDAYVLIAPPFAAIQGLGALRGLDFLGEPIPERIQVARVQLSAPVATATDPAAP